MATREFVEKSIEKISSSHPLSPSAPPLSQSWSHIVAEEESTHPPPSAPTSSSSIPSSTTDLAAAAAVAAAAMLPLASASSSSSSSTAAMKPSSATSQPNSLTSVSSLTSAPNVRLGNGESWTSQKAKKGKGGCVRYRYTIEMTFSLMSSKQFENRFCMNFDVEGTSHELNK